MSLKLIQSAFSSGELAPSFFGRVDLNQFHVGAATMKNFFVNYKGGASSRAGTAFIGRCLQDGNAPPPRDINFQFNINQSYALEFGEKYMRVKAQGAYVLEDPQIISGISQSNPTEITVISHGFANGDWVYLSGIGGMVELNAQTYQIAGVTADTFQLLDIFGDFVDSLSFPAYTSGGTAQCVFTLATPYAAADLPLLKFAQSADVMTLTHQNYPIYDLTRLAANSWILTEVTFGSVIAAPLTLTAVATTTTSSNSTSYEYTVTAVDAVTGQESVRSPFGTVSNSVDIASVAGSINLTWSAVDGAGSYNIYRAPEAYASVVPAGAILGFVGSSLGLSFVDSNIVADFSVTPPLHKNPFANSSIINANVTAGGSGYTSAPTITVNTSTGSGAVLTPVIVGGALAAIIIENAGQDYALTDTIVISGGSGSDAAASLTLGSATGNYPGVVAYFQQRRVYASTINNPDTYFMSQPGSFDNFDEGQIPIDSDAIIGTPWAQQVNGITSLVPMPGGLVVLTGLGAWQVSGGGNVTPITPSDQQAQPQAYNGCSPIVPPITINYDILYVQAKGSIVRDLAYDFYRNIYTGTDLSILSNHLFTGYDILQWAWCEEPYKIIWAVRNDGTMLSFTFEKPQEIAGWARHSTKGTVVSVCSVSEPPVDALYIIVRRFINGQWLYYSERMNNRLWQNDVELSWCVDAGLALPQPTPDATLQASASMGQMTIGEVTIVDGGSGYTTPTLVIVDPTGSGAEAEATVVGGVITAVNVIVPGSGYTSPKIVISDATGTGAVLAPVISNKITFTASAAVFSAENIGDVIRSGGGIATITDYISPLQVKAELTRQIAYVIPEDPLNTPLPVTSGNWTMTTPQSVLSGLIHLRGQPVSVLADGSVVDDIVVGDDGTIVLEVPASQITVGLPFTAQLQSLYTDDPRRETVQGRFKNIYAVTVRTEASRGIQVGSNQVDSSTQVDNLNVQWNPMIEAKQRGNSIGAGVAMPLYTGDVRIEIPASWQKPGQIAVQQIYPLPANVLAFIPELEFGSDD